MKWLAIAYFYPTSSSREWGNLLALKHLQAVVINPANGIIPGLSAGDVHNWKWAVKECYRRGIFMVGYVATKWGKRPSDEVIQNMNDYRRTFGISSFFFDEAATGLDRVEVVDGKTTTIRQLSYYAELRDNVQNGTIVLNPGTPPHSRYFEVGDIIVTRETDNKALADPTADERLFADRCCHIFHHCSAAEALDQMGKCPAIGSRWFTSAGYSTLPGYVNALDSLL